MEPWTDTVRIFPLKLEVHVETNWGFVVELQDKIAEFKKVNCVDDVVASIRFDEDDLVMIFDIDKPKEST